MIDPPFIRADSSGTNRGGGGKGGGGSNGLLLHGAKGGRENTTSGSAYGSELLVPILVPFVAKALRHRKARHSELGGDTKLAKIQETLSKQIGKPTHDD